MKQDSFLSAISPYIFLAVFAFFCVKAGFTADACAAIIFCLGLGALLGGYAASYVYEKLDGKVKKFRYLYVPAFILFSCLFFAAALAFTSLELFDNSEVSGKNNSNTSVVLSSKSTHSGKQTKATTIADYYQQNYPMVWGYIEKNTAFPEDYIEFYHDVWGDLQKYTGDGINFHTLTKREQMLVDYPTIGSYIFFSSANSREYHSTYKCYTLLKSNPIAKKSSLAYMYSPCSKCVGD